jgi:uncharacterized damage-inducible protein DinB
MMPSDKSSETENKMTPAERDKLLKNLEESRERLLLTAKNLSREQLHYRPAPDRWTVAECLEHISLVETRVLGAIHKTLEAPEPLVPTGRWPDDQLLNEFEGTRQQTRAFAVSTTADLRHHFYKHPALGELDLYQWMILIAAHCDRHRVQSEEVMASPDFPRSRQANAPN